MPKADRTSINLAPRIVGAAIVCAVCLSVLIARLWYLQIVRGSFFRDRSENNRLRTIFVPSPRGVISDRHGEPLVSNRPSFNIELVVEDAPNVAQVVSDVAMIVGENSQELQERLSGQNKRRRFEPKILLRDVSRDVVAKVSAQKHRLPGVIVSVVPVREYPYGALAAHAVGYLREISADQLKSTAYQGYRAGEMVGQSGIEATLEHYVRGERGAQAVIVNARGTKIGEAFFQPEIPGSDVHLTIDRRVQQAAERALQGRRGAVVALHAQTGEVLALASAPAFEPSLFTGEIPKDVWADLTDPKSTKLSNRALQGARAIAALVNGGRLLKPRIVSKVVASDGRVLEQREGGPQVLRVLDIDPAILAEIKKGMIGVVQDKRGTGKRAALPKESAIGVGGKTGTAQVASRESGIEHEDHAWFAGFAPADNPQIVVVALIENGGHGGEVAAPVTRAVLMEYFGIQEPKTETPTRPTRSPARVQVVRRLAVSTRRGPADAG